jgi:hypothetical protein
VNPIYAPVAERANYRCEYCHAPEDAFNFPFEVDHILPMSRGGSDDLDNLALSCRACNSYKSFFEIGIDSETDTQTLLFNPRRNVWHEHFHVDRETAEIAGLTITGRATVRRLQMNLPRQLTARLRWMQFDLFP